MRQLPVQFQTSHTDFGCGTQMDRKRACSMCKWAPAMPGPVGCGPSGLWNNCEDKLYFGGRWSAESLYEEIEALRRERDEALAALAERGGGEAAAKL